MFTCFLLKWIQQLYEDPAFLQKIGFQPRQSGGLMTGCSAAGSFLSFNGGNFSGTAFSDL